MFESLKIFQLVSYTLIYVVFQSAVCRLAFDDAQMSVLITVANTTFKYFEERIM